MDYKLTRPSCKIFLLYKQPISKKITATGCSAVVAHLSGGQVVAGSNPVTPRNLSPNGGFSAEGYGKISKKSNPIKLAQW